MEYHVYYQLIGDGRLTVDAASPRKALETGEEILRRDKDLLMDCADIVTVDVLKVEAQ